MYRNEQIADVRYSIDRMVENLKHCLLWIRFRK
nr:MAG TPA: hypothetical protein [Caudoviricetes sp.]